MREVIRLVDRCGYSQLSTVWLGGYIGQIQVQHGPYVVNFFRTTERDRDGRPIYRPSPIEAIPIRYPDRLPSDLRVDFSLEPPHGHP